MTKEETEFLFMYELKALLKKYNAELSAKDHYQGYPECGEDVRMTVDINGINGIECDYIELDLGEYIDGKD